MFVCFVFVAFVGLPTEVFANHRPESPNRSGDAVRLLLDCTVQARQVYALTRLRPAAESAKASALRHRVLRDFSRLAQLDPTPATLRRQAVLEFTLGEPSWKTTLLKLRDADPASSPLDVERELSLWRTAFEGHPAPTDIPKIRAAIEEKELGWFQHLALASAYDRAGMTGEAEREREAAQRSSTRLEVASAINGGLTILGLLIGLYAARRLWIKYRDPYAPLPAALVPVPPALLTKPQGNTLYTVFLVYILSLALIRLLAPLAVGALLEDGAGVLTGTQTALLTLAVSVVSLIPPLLAFLLLAPRVGLTAEQIGLRTSSLRVDILWGFAGYMVALPLVAAANSLSSWLFQGIKSPTHPALVELAASHNLVLQILVLLQAVLLAPVIEETLFRGVFFRSLSPRAGRVSALLMASAVFALLHPQLPLGFLGLFVLGAVFNVLYLFRGSLVPCMVAHALNNTAILIFFTLLIGE